MKVILKAHVKGVGPQGAVVNVSDGHARNFLIPKGLAVSATDKNIQQLERKKVLEADQQKRDKDRTSTLVSKLDGYQLIMKEKVSDSGTLYAALSPQKIAAALKKAGFVVEAKMVKLKDALKEAGEHKVKIDLPHGFKATIKLIIKKQ